MLLRDKLNGKLVFAAPFAKPGTLDFDAAQTEVQSVLTIRDETFGHYDPVAQVWHLKSLVGTLCAYPGEWILNDHYGRPWIMSDKTLHRNYTDAIEEVNAPCM